MVFLFFFYLKVVKLKLNLLYKYIFYHNDKKYDSIINQILLVE
jgi:hypothetical protein